VWTTDAVETIGDGNEDCKGTSPSAYVLIIMIQSIGGDQSQRFAAEIDDGKAFGKSMERDRFERRRETSGGVSGSQGHTSNDSRNVERKQICAAKDDVYDAEHLSEKVGGIKV